MKTSPQFIAQFLTLVFAISITAFCYLSVSAQNSVDSEKDKIFLPSEENFVKATGVVLPWRESYCAYFFAENKIPYCNQVDTVQWSKMNLTNLYNSDGSLWYQIDNQASNDSYFGKFKNTGFLPYAMYGSYLFYGDAVLRVIKESPNWYEVEVNIKTGATKFVLKSDPLWAKINWEYWLAKMYYFGLEGDQQKLLDKPDGKVIEELADLNFTEFLFLEKIEGDWTLVEGRFKKNNIMYVSDEYKGWIRWRKDGKLLINDGKLFITKAETQK